MHPEVNSKVDKWISATGTYFQAYLRRALNNLKSDDPDMPKGGSSEGLLPSVSTSRQYWTNLSCHHHGCWTAEPTHRLICVPHGLGPATAAMPVSPSMSTLGSDSGAGPKRTSRSQSQDVDLTRLQSLFEFESTTTSPTRAQHTEWLLMEHFLLNCCSQDLSRVNFCYIAFWLVLSRSWIFTFVFLSGLLKNLKLIIN